VDGRVLGFLGVCVLVGAALAPVAGRVWVVLADPPTVRVAANGGLYLGEQALNQQSGVTLWFLVVGAAFGAVAGLVVGWFGRRFGWPAVIGVLLLCLVGSLGSRYLGVHVFGPDPAAAAAHAAVGTPVQLDVRLDTRVAYLGWPIGGLVGALAAIAGWSRSDSSRAENSPQAPPIA
jgi:ABC-type uncharacterized transport system permease subunit